ncbi:MAG: heavy-metal-associated domain-containing protein [Lachnospiraceae bacterium]|nr:heavy-metal-associated domain-containing protein [Lachnospiraceae bacterium]MBQ2982058.1 heavy-metal-associated domain-containing protein [Lachnospiraceae bacterium]
MAVLKVEGMHCGKCVERITNALNQVNLDFNVSLEDKTVTINGCDQCVKTAISELDDLGFDAVVQ